MDTTWVTIIDLIDRKEILIGRLECSLLKKPHTSEHETPNLIIVNGYGTCLKQIPPSANEDFSKTLILQLKPHFMVFDVFIQNLPVQ